MSDGQMVTRALETNSFQATATAAGYINPEIWVKQIRDFAKAKIVMEPLGKKYMELLGQAGDTLNVQISAELAAAALTESTAITPGAISYTQVVFTPSEYGLAVALTRKERIRSINDIMMEKTKEMGYSLAKVKDSKIIATLVSGTGNSVNVNSVATSAIASSDVLGTDDIANAVTAIRSDDYDAKYIVIHPACENNLIKLSDFIDSSVYGGREVVMNGEIGKYLGMKVLVTTLIPRNSTTTTARDNLVLDDEAFGVAYKMPITFNSDYKVLEREFVLAAVEEFDVQVLHANKVCTLTAYGG
ncbi:N4-gp56 family major capsid protein [uncultured Arcobacter sp.]|uniref:N4-gp56 family major capsid protein n=1 Tax=uncultured Arcobacter sp. TaxID=165434 RepID=UPI002639279E|nr:N4-gp56 family major capsid protein [uncultured Arcobacter sp.]